MNAYTFYHNLHGDSELRLGSKAKNNRPGTISFELQLIHRTAQGDCEAFAALYDQYCTPLYSFAVRILGDHLEAEDVLQEAFIKIWEKAATFKEELGDPFTWAAIITRNKAIDRLRSRQRQDQMLTQAAEASAMDVPGNETGLVEPDINNQSTLIRSIVNGLPENQRRPIELAFFNGLIHTEIAEKLQEPLGTIKARIRRGMLKLRDKLEWHTEDLSE